MSKKSENYYFDNFIDSIAISCNAARMLKECLIKFNAATLPSKLEKLHQIEHMGDEKKHELTAKVVHAFITPIERDDIIALSQNIDDVTDQIEDILIRMYINNITQVRDDALNFSNLIISCCDAVKDMLEEFRNFKKSTMLKECIIKINKIEEEGDEMFINSMRNLHVTVTDPLLVAAWSEIYGYFEKCLDSCEDVADRVEVITIGNT